MRTRFAPSPTGLLHLGHAYSALYAQQLARRAGGEFVIRIEDIDHTRCRPEFEEQCLTDLKWLGIESDVPVVRQSERLASYQSAIQDLRDQKLLYPCFCTRKDIEREIASAGSAPHGSEGPVYPGTCRRLSAEEREQQLAEGQSCCWRLNSHEALERVGDLHWQDAERGAQPVLLEIFGDVVLARKDIDTSYHLAVTVDDAEQEITLVTRGEDLLEATAIHRLLQALLGLPVPEWSHHKLLTDASGRRLAKRDRSTTLQSIREAGRSAHEVRTELGF